LLRQCIIAWATVVLGVFKSMAESIWQLKVTIKGSKPPIWRRIQVPANLSLSTLHQILQIALGWDNYHLYEFQIGDEHYGEPTKDDASWGPEVRSARRARLNRVVGGEGGKFVYQYDFGDDWEHAIVVEKVLPAEIGTQYPRCVTGKRACPPEDCGGIWGYYNLLTALRDPQHEEHAQMLEWVGGEFDPEAFDASAVNALLGHLR
jgi:Plasmid pRiA4b ORF-3-like protein